ncbi:DUF3955 domain-containing protein [Candidatus Hamiltonella defensa]|uniref:DUF3955 domain-containing protein n=1 Tax=Candidatus Williamhamiltonella defendens TaxID=138072 RepID=A0AAC9VL64_9ENTR|nr:DUF3955 domain-containing protein [Candidatus Hamiltonella defensa]ASV34042.1 hypothetical protein CJJ18_08705 [Candidatus Hamiltonella defensa]AWK16999.1 hypothetical protein CCS40_08525 [Candidatus Hamiltonella defensa]MBK4362104.1 DUF3955 domain-containing protein [Candidatus Hamiltonella defensa]
MCIGSLKNRKFLRLMWFLMLSFSILVWFVHALFSDKTSWVDTDGFLHESLFGLIPISYFFALVAIVLALFDLALKFRKYN